MSPPYLQVSSIVDDFLYENELTTFQGNDLSVLKRVNRIFKESVFTINFPCLAYLLQCGCTYDVQMLLAARHTNV